MQLLSVSIKFIKVSNFFSDASPMRSLTIPSQSSREIPSRVSDSSRRLNLKLSSERNFVLGQCSNSFFHLINLPDQVLFLNLQLLPRRGSFFQGSCHLIQLLIRLNNKSVSQLAISPMIGKVLHAFIQTSTDLLKDHAQVQPHPFQPWLSSK